MSLDKIVVANTLLGNALVIGRIGKQAGVLLESRAAESMIIKAITEHMMDDAPKGASKTYSFDGETYYELTVRPVAKPKTVSNT